MQHNTYTHIPILCSLFATDDPDVPHGKLDCQVDSSLDSGLLNYHSFRRRGDRIIRNEPSRFVSQKSTARKGGLEVMFE